MEEKKLLGVTVLLKIVTVLLKIGKWLYYNLLYFLFSSGQDCRKHLEDITGTQGMIIKLLFKKAKIYEGNYL
jgi:hypothetical protein